MKKNFMITMATVLGLMSMGVHAEVCTWSLIQSSQITSMGDHGTGMSYECKTSGNVRAATRFLFVRDAKSTLCYVGLSNGYANIGDCFTPNIVKRVVPSCKSISLPACNGDYWCAESFSRSCSSAGGETEYGSPMRCKVCD